MSAARVRRTPFARRRVRLAVLAVLLVAAGLTVARVAAVRRGDGAGREHWRLHDEGLVLFEAGRFEEAAAAYRRILAERPGDKLARFNLGSSLVRAGDEAGWAEIEAVATADPGFDDAQLALADRAISRGALAEASTRLSAAIESPPEPPGARLRLAELLLSSGHRGEALRQLEQVLRRGGDTPLVRAAAAVALAREHGRQADLHRSPAEERARERRAYRFALQVIDETPGLDRPPEDWDASTVALAALRPFALAAEARHEEALGALETVLRAQVEPVTRASLRVLRSQLYWLEGDEARAEAELAAVLGDAGGIDAAAFAAAADLYEARGFRERAGDALERGLLAHPDDVGLRLALARVQFLTGRPDAAEATLCAGAEIPASDPALLFLGDLRRYRGDRLAAHRAYELLLQRRPQRKDVALRLAALEAQAAFQDGTAGPAAFADLEALAHAALERDADDAEARLALARARLARSAGDEMPRPALTAIRDALKRAIDSDPLLFEAHVVLAHVQARLGAYDEAAVGLERVLAALPAERAELRILLSEAYLGLGAPARALAEARRAVDGLGNDARALQAVVAAARLAGDHDACLDALARLVSIEPDVIAHRLAQAYLLAAAGDVARSEACFSEAERIADGLGDENARAVERQRIADARAAAYLRRGDVDGARSVFDALLGRYPDRAEARVAYGRFLRATGQDEQAERAFQAALAVAPDSLLPRRALLDLWADRGEPTDELVDLVRGMREVGGDAPLVLYAEGRLAAVQGDVQVARERLQACAADLRDDADAQFALGVVLSRAGRLDESVDALSRAVALAPRSARARDALARARFALARELARLGRLRAARDLLEGSVRDDPDATAPRRALAGLIGVTESIDVSEPQIREMLARDPGDVVLRRMLATALIQKDDNAGAARELLRVAESTPDDWTVWSSLSLVRLRLGDAEGAALFADRARDAAPDDPRSLAPRLQVLALTGRGAEVRALLDAAHEEHPDEPFYLLMRAVLSARESRFDDVVADAGAALELAPGMTGAAHLAVNALRYGLGSPERALGFARTCAERVPEEPEYSFLVGWLASDAGDGGAALDELRPLTERDPPHQAAVESVALILMRSGDTAAARELLDRGLALNPENPNFHYLRAQSLLTDAVAAGDTEVRGATRGVVIAALQRTLELAPQHHTARNNLAYVLSADQDRLDEALEHALRAAAEAPKHAPYADTLGTVQMRLGRLDEAVDSFRRGLAIIEESRAILDRPDGTLAVSEPGRAQRLRRRLERQEAEIRRHYDEALRLRRGR